MNEPKSLPPPWVGGSLLTLEKVRRALELIELCQESKYTDGTRIVLTETMKPHVGAGMLFALAQEFTSLATEEIGLLPWDGPDEDMRAAIDLIADLHAFSNELLESWCAIRALKDGGQ